MEDLWKMEAPARTFEEFLVSQNLDDWPKFPYMPDMDVHPLATKLRKDYPLDTVTKYLHDKAPLDIETITNLEKRVNECKIKVHEHAKHVFIPESEKSEVDSQGPSLPEQGADTSAPESQDMRIKKVKVALGIKDSHCKGVENFKFPGFNLRKLTKLPNHLEPAQLWDSVLKVQTFKGMNIKVLKKLFLSEASLAILQDCFWWLFLHKFKPDQEEQDHFFDRISDSFVALLLSTPHYIKDPFFQMYPDCLSQTIYNTFCEAFPDSHSCFNDEFKEELMDLVFQWTRGFKPRKDAWKEWKLPEPTKHNKQKDSLYKPATPKKRLLRVQIRSHSSIFQSLAGQRQRRGNVNQGDLMPAHFRLVKEKLKEKMREKKKESHYVGDGPDFQRSLFNLGGQSPLVVYYLQMHGIPNTLAHSRAYRINHSEICKVPPLYPTYQDVIEKSEKFSEKRHNDFIKFESKCAQEMARMEEEREKVNRKYRRMMETITEKPTEARLKTEKFLTQMENAKPRKPTANTPTNV